MFYKSDNKDFTDRPSYSSNQLKKDEFDSKVELDKLIDNWEQLDWVEQIGNNLEDK